MIAAMMTAANLGARFTGWGFVVFLVGSICWSIVGASTGQTNLLATNGFLTLVNMVGIWRWLGRQRVYEDGGHAAAEASQNAPAPTLFPAGSLAGMAVVDCHGAAIGKAVEAMVECGSGRISYVVVASGGIGGVAESLRAVAREQMGFGNERITLTMESAAFQRLPLIDGEDWPATPPAG
ncbi:PRC-barrel domain-containing protein [Croceibacterium xixiisoli]|nr:PRC-barrel domain-containing protein [Croceibacterium xixiisoli]